ncbi:glycosyltransferase [Marinobacter salarius]|uniref:glycosyltransferase n=1 Tax=Marinobacter salarius TaxID=1420917 RepID=UPI000F8558F9|nr:glycosyltransferase [Marinobacter salarius]AZR42396.1 O-antigen biosynthesis protein RfbC [Marinobacter salarius]
MNNKAKMIVTLGMHRSGTSAITRGLEVLGVSLGDRLMAGVQDINDKGFFEDVDLVNINIRIMGEMGLAWDSLEEAQLTRLSEEKRVQFNRAADDFLVARSRQYPKYGIKDPRLCRLLPFWEDAFKRNRIEAKGLIAIRNPFGVAASLSKRDGFHPVKSHYLWLRHVLESLRDSGWMRERTVVDYDQLMSDPVAQLNRISQQLGLTVNKNELERYQSQFLDDGLRHFAPGGNWDSMEISSLVTTTYDLLRALAADELTFDDDEFRRRIEDVFRQYRDVSSLLNYCATLEKGSRASLAGLYSSKTPTKLFLEHGETLQFPIPSTNQANLTPLSSAERINQWLELRAPSKAELDFIARRVSAPEQWPKLHIAVLEGNNQESFIADMQETLDSLAIAAEQIPSVEITVLCPPGLDEVALAQNDGAPVSFRSSDAAIDSLNRLCREGSADWVLPVVGGVQFTTWGLMRLTLELFGAEGLSGVYADELIKADDRDLGTGFRPDFNLDLLLSYPSSLSRNWLFNRQAVLDVGGFRSSSGRAFGLDLILRLVEQEGVGAFAHSSEPLLIDGVPVPAIEDEPRVLEEHLHNRGYESACIKPALPGIWRLDYGHSQTPLVSIILVTRNNIESLQRCVETLLEETAYKKYEIIIVDNESDSKHARTWLDGLSDMGLDQVQVLSWEGAFNSSEMVNFGASKARGEYVLFLSDSAAIIRSGWLDALLNHALRPEVGVVGAKLLSPDGKVRHSGMVLGLGGVVGSPFLGEDLAAAGYMYRLQVDQNYSAVSEDCLMARKSVFEAVGGLNSVYSETLSGVDFCLRVRESGFLTVWTPHSIVMVAAEQMRDGLPKDDKLKTHDKGGGETFSKQWLPVMANDPSYNRNFSLDGRGFDLEARADRVPKPLDLGQDVPRLLVHNADPWGCGHYRVIKPFEAMRRDGLADGWQSHEWSSVTEIARLNPDMMLLQRQTSEYAIKEMRRMKELAGKFLVYELDDYLPNLPVKSIHKKHIPADILKSIRRAVKWVDRFVVSTAPLAEAFAGVHPDIRVVENRLPVEWWANVQGEGQQSEKPRVGWAGGKGHTGDLELVADVVAHLAEDVDWVFFGMCPDKLRPYVKEFHEGVEINEYPQKLASLNLDLAIAPLEDNLFNRCKSNLRLLEYGACGFPVICSDVEPYRAHNLPVTRVRNRFKDWVDAIMDHTQSRAESARQGDQLRKVVRSNWMLEGEGLKQWLETWIP